MAASAGQPETAVLCIPAFLYLLNRMAVTLFLKGKRVIEIYGTPE